LIPARVARRTKEVRSEVVVDAMNDPSILAEPCNHLTTHKTAGTCHNQPSSHFANLPLRTVTHLLSAVPIRRNPSWVGLLFVGVSKLLGLDPTIRQGAHPFSPQFDGQECSTLLFVTVENRL
jgi:hypothetical protein